MMTYRLRLFALLFVAGMSSAAAQNFDITRWHVGAGATFPTAPAGFYDYWSRGYQLMVGAELASSTEFVQYMTADVNLFPFDQGRFLQRAAITNAATNVTGASTYVLDVAYNVRYTVAYYESFQPSFAAGLGVGDAIVTSSTVSYPIAPANVDGRNYLYIVMPLSFSLEVYKTGDAGLLLSVIYNLGLTDNQSANTNFSCLRVEYSFKP